MRALSFVSTNLQEEIRARLPHGLGLLAQLKRANRATLFSVESQRESVEDEKLASDSSKLQLDNFGYERETLLQRIRACRTFEYVALERSLL